MKESSVQSSASLRAESVQDMDESEAVMISDSDSLGDEEEENESSYSLADSYDDEVANIFEHECEFQDSKG